MRSNIQFTALVVLGVGGLYSCLFWLGCAADKALAISLVLAFFAGSIRGVLRKPTKSPLPLTEDNEPKFRWDAYEIRVQVNFVEKTNDETRDK